MKADATLDCVGLYCPMPIYNTAKKIKELKNGEVLVVLASDEGIKEDAPAWCRATGNEFLGIEEEGGEYRVYIRKSAK
jgi:tRNA 2-thiouridine synthesizing protein A